MKTSLTETMHFVRNTNEMFQCSNDAIYPDNVFSMCNNYNYMPMVCNNTSNFETLLPDWVTSDGKNRAY